jgi:hypothetical protein
MNDKTLRRAIALLRQLADAVEREGGGWFVAENLRGYHEPVNADLIATLSPAVALDMANLLNDEIECSHRCTQRRAFAVTLARSVLGEST